MDLQGKEISKLPLCGVFAVSHVAKQPLQKVYDLFAKLEGKQGNWRGRTSHDSRIRALRALDIDHVVLNLPNLRLNAFMKLYGNLDASFIVQTTGHVQVVENGFVLDQGNPLKIHHKLKNRKVGFVILIK